MKIANTCRESDNARVAKELKRLAALLGIESSYSLAKRAGVSPATVHDLGHRTKITARTLFKLADAVGVPFSHFRPCFDLAR